MADLANYPLEDNFKTTLSQQWTGGTGTINVASTPSFTFPSGITTYIVVNPGKSNMQIAEINAIGTGTLTVSNITLEKGASINSTAQTHNVGSEVIISDNYQFWKDIADSLNSKLNDDADWEWDSATDFGGAVMKSLTTAQRTALTAENGMVVYDTDIGEIYQYLTGAWSAVSAGSTQPNASATVAGKVEIATTAEVKAGTDTGGTGASVSALPSDIGAAIQEQSYTYGVDGGSANTYTLAVTPAITSYTDGMRVSVEITNANTGASTLNIDGVGAGDIVDRDGDALVAGQLRAGAYYDFVYDLTNTRWTLMNTDNLVPYVANLEDIDVGEVIFVDNDGNAQLSHGVDKGSDTFSPSGTFTNVSIFKLTDTTFVVVYDETSADDIFAIAGTISANQITFGSIATIESTGDIQAGSTVGARLSDTHFLIGYDAGATSHDNRLICCSVSGTTITAGTNISVDAAGFAQYCSLTAVSDTKFVYSWNDLTNTDIGAICGTVSGTTITLGSEVTLKGTITGVTSVCKIGTDKVLFYYASSGEGYTRVGTITGTVIALGTEVNSSGIGATEVRLTRVQDDMAIVGYKDTTYFGSYITVSGTTPTVQTARAQTGLVFGINGNWVIGMGASQAYISHLDTTGYTLDEVYNLKCTCDTQTAEETFITPLGTGQILNLDMGTSTSTCYISDIAPYKLVAGNTATSGGNTRINGRLATGYSSLVPGFKYYSDDAGAVSINTTDAAGNSEQEIGVAISATEIILS